MNKIQMNAMPKAVITMDGEALKKKLIV